MNDVEVRVARIFNTCGLRMFVDEGRVVGDFNVQVLRGQLLTLYVDGSQTGSFCFVSDLIEGLIRLLDRDHTGPVNLGNPSEFTIRALADLVRERINPQLPLIEHPLPQDDPLQRRPSIDLAMQPLDWRPTVSLEQGLAPTIDSFRKVLALEESVGA